MVKNKKYHVVISYNTRGKSCESEALPWDDNLGEPTEYTLVLFIKNHFGPISNRISACVYDWAVCPSSAIASL